MQFFVGLGNPGDQYAHSRHNMGWRIVNQLQSADSSKWKFDKALEADTKNLGGSLLVKPQTYMNLSGNAVKSTIKKYNYVALCNQDFHALFVIYDDLDLEVGKYKIVFGSGPKVHNGVNDVIAKLGSDQFWHIRIGVDGRRGDRSVEPQEYVLSGFTQDEQLLIDKVVDSVSDLLTKKISS